MSTATARPTPKSLPLGSSLRTKAPNTLIMISAAEVITRAVLDRPLTTASWLSPLADVLLADAGQEEHLVVHREAEEDGEHDQWEERVDRHRGVQPDELDAPQPHWNTATSTP